MSRSDPPVQFGPNEWLVEEMYEQFLANPSAVDSSWHDFFADYRPASQGTINGKTPHTSTLTPAKQPPRKQSPANGNAHAAIGDRESASVAPRGRK